MLKPLLLLCWTAIFVSAGDQKTNSTNGAAILVPQEETSIKPLVDIKSAILNSAHVSSESDADKSKVSPLVTSTEKTPNPTTDISVTPPPTTKPTTTPTTTTTPLTTTTSSTTTTSTTTTVPSNITTLAPTPAPHPPDIKKWIVKQNQTFCIIVQMAAQFSFSYSDNNKTIQKTMDIPGHGNGTVSGTCGNTEQNLTVSWNALKNLDNFTLHFVKDETTKHYSLHHFEISLAPEEFPDDKWNKTVTLVHMVPQYETGLSNSYRCLKEQKLDLHMNGMNETVGHLTVSNLQFQAFRNNNNTVFGLAKDCAFDTPDIVPITVGCALAGLVVIVLIAYLVGRRRSQARGYLSM